ncbi:MAG: hypothetical protein R2704_12410 [Microthrixaceae bacterium]
MDALRYRTVPKQWAGTGRPYHRPIVASTPNGKFTRTARWEVPERRNHEAAAASTWARVLLRRLRYP